MTSCTRRFFSVITLLVGLFAGSLFAQPYTDMYSNMSSVPIPANGWNFLNIVIPAGQPIVNRVRVKVNVAFPTDGDLLIQLVRTNPIVNLSSNNGGTGSNFINTVFDDFTSTPIALGTAPFTGYYIPSTPLATLNGFDPVGTWQLLVSNSGSNTGGLLGWSLELNVPQVLPVEMTSFFATGGDAFVRLNWHTETETGNAHFNLYRSLFSSERGVLIGQAEGHGTTATPNSYRFTDRAVVNGTTYYYRISDVSNDGVERMSAVVVHATPVATVASSVVGTFQLSKNFPNPFNPSTTIAYRIPKAAQVEMKLFDVSGRQVQSIVSQTQAAGSYTVQIDGSALSAGTYLVSLQAGEFSQTQKIELLK